VKKLNVIFAIAKRFAILIFKKIEISRENELAKLVIDQAFELHDILGPGLLESVYEECLVHLLKDKVNLIERQKPIPVKFQGVRMNIGFRCDLILDKQLIVELKSVEYLQDVHTATLLTYLRLTNIKLGLLLNFNTALLRYGIKRVVNGL
jgi:GxxExxY protein